MSKRRGHRQSKAPASQGKVVMPTKDWSHMRHRYYIVRPEPNKTCVPMIALDELPPGFRLKGVPMTVTPQQIQEWDMARVGADVKFKYTFETDFEPRVASQRDQRPRLVNSDSAALKKSEVPKEAASETSNTGVEVSGSAIGTTDSSNNSDSHDKTEAVHLETGKDTRPLKDLQQQANNAADEFVEQSKWDKENDRSKTQDAATPGIYGKKRFCTHWIRTGNCDYMQEGCRYLHVIPDAETRLRIGIRDMPRWAKEDLPSPPRETFRVRRHSSSPPKDSKKDTHKDWRIRGNRKGQAELPASQHPIRSLPMRSSTPTPQSSKEINQQGPQRGSSQMQKASPLGKTDTSILAASQANSNSYEGLNRRLIQQSSLSGYKGTMDSTTSQPAATAATLQEAYTLGQQIAIMQESAMRQQPPPPLPSNSSSLPLHSSVPSGFYSGTAQRNHSRYGYGPSIPAQQYSTFGSSLPPIAAPSFGSRDARLDDGRWVHSSYQPQGSMGHHLMQPQSKPFPGSSASAPLFQGLLDSPTPSFSDASVGTIGHGRPSNASPFSPVPGPPILHKRLFRQPGESQYVEAQPEPKAVTSKDGSRGRSHKGKSAMAQEGAGKSDGRSGQLGNLIAFDE